MKVSEITADDIASYIRLEEGEYRSKEIDAIRLAAIEYIAKYTGIPQKTESSGDVETLDEHEDFYIVVMILSQDMYDNRSLYVDNKALNKTVETILGMHCRNLIAR